MWSTHDGLMAMKHRITCNRGMLVTNYRLYKAWQKGFAPTNIDVEAFRALSEEDSQTWSSIEDRLNRYYFPRSDESRKRTAYMVRGTSP